MYYFNKVNSIPPIKRKTVKRSTMAENVVTAFFETGYRHAILNDMPWKLASDAVYSIKKYAKENKVPVHAEQRRGLVYLTVVGDNNIKPINNARPRFRKTNTKTPDISARM